MNNGFNILLWLEGNHNTVYKDHAGYKTVCMGVRTNKPVGTRVRNCEQINQQYWNKYRQSVAKLVRRADIQAHQLDAFTLFAYNIGINGFKKSSALRAFNMRKPDYLVSANMQKWNQSRIGGVKQVDSILVKRRALEAAMFQSATYADKSKALAAQGAPRAVKPDSEGLLSIIRRSKTAWGNSAVGLLGGGLGAGTTVLDKIHPLTINLVVLLIVGLSVFLIFNRYRDAQIGEHF